jgi:hypothetical protein
MKSARTLIMTLAAAISMAPYATGADYKTIHGRTGLPKVMEGKQKVWMDRGIVHLDASRNDLTVTQEFRLHYPGPPIEKGPQQIKVAVREDYYRSKGDTGMEVMPQDAQGFKAFAVYVDGKRVDTMAEPWDVNKNHNTATRWRTWHMDFQPDQFRSLKVVSRAPLGEQYDRKIVQFVSKDVGHWRDKPEYLEIRFSAPGKTEAKLAGLEPKANDINQRAVRWVYRKASPNRDVYIQLPPGYGRK